MRALPDPFRVFLASGESSGDGLGAGLMRHLRQQTEGKVHFTGIGGPLMVGEGLHSLFPSSELAIIGPTAVVPRLPHLWRRLRQSVRFILDNPPDVLVLIDCPEFTQRIARRVRRVRPDIMIIKYVAPQAWAWRAGRVPRMRAHLDHIMAFLPFEPEFYARLKGPETTYVGHPMIEKVTLMRAPGEGSHGPDSARPVLLVLPGSRRSEIDHLMAVFGQTVKQVSDELGPLEILVPAVAHLEADIRRRTAAWSVPVTILRGEDEKWRGFRRARAALAASGTVSLELALAHVPMVIAYKVEPWSAIIMRRLIKTSTVVLANLVIGRNVVPEFLQERARPDLMAAALSPLISGGPARDRQIEAFKGLDQLMGVGTGSPSERAARVVIEAYQRRVETGT